MNAEIHASGTQQFCKNYSQILLLGPRNSKWASNDENLQRDYRVSQHKMWAVGNNGPFMALFQGESNLSSNIGVAETFKVVEAYEGKVQ